jgi:SPP1 gp7 family putative phage head morphogenesis protein
MTRRRRKSAQYDLAPLIALLVILLELAGKLIIGVARLLAWWFRTLLRLFRWLFIRTTEKPAPFSNGAPPAETVGNVIYRGLSKEMAGPIGTRVKRLLQDSCKRTPLTVALPAEVIEYIRAESLKGNRAEAIAKGLTVMLPDMPHEQLVSISRTIIGKASTALERARSEDIGIYWYVWETSKDARVRKSHRKMHGVIVPWNSPPSPEELIGEEETEGKYHAGEALECRCLGLPLVSLSEVNWPHRVYHKGQIQRMTRVEFKRLSGMT